MAFDDDGGGGGFGGNDGNNGDDVYSGDHVLFFSLYFIDIVWYITFTESLPWKCLLLSSVFPVSLWLVSCIVRFTNSVRFLCYLDMWLLCFLVCSVLLHVIIVEAFQGHFSEYLCKLRNLYTFIFYLYCYNYNMQWPNKCNKYAN